MTISNATLQRSLAVLALGPSLGMLSASAYAAGTSNSGDDLFREGLYQDKLGNVYTAIEAFQSVLASRPTLDRARLELAAAYYKALNFEEAKRQAQMVLDKPDTPENVKLSILAFLAQVKKDEAAFQKRNVWEKSFSAGLLYDSNANAGPSSDVVQGGGLTFAIPNGSVKKGDTAVVLSAGATHRYQFQEPVRIGQTAAQLLWQSHVGYYGRQYLSEHAFSLDDVSLSTGPAWFALNKWRANIDLQADYYRYGGDMLAWYTSLVPSVSWQLDKGEFTWDALVQKRVYKRNVDAGRDSLYLQTGIYLGHIFRDGKVAVQGGLRVFNESADASYYSNHGTEAFIGANVVAWKNASVYGRYTVRSSKYDGTEPNFSYSRKDTLGTYEVGFYQDFHQGMLDKWRLTGSYIHYGNSSNVPYVAYGRDMTSLVLSRSFN